MRWGAPVFSTMSKFSNTFSLCTRTSNTRDPDMAWFGDRWSAMGVIIAAEVWKTTPFIALLLLAGLTTIDEGLYEAAKVDGANAWQRFWRITLPLLRPALFTVLTLGLIGCWQVFDQIYTGTQGGPGKSTLTPAYLSYQAAFTDQRWGQGAAVSFVLFVIIVVFTIIQRWALRERDVSTRRLRRRYGLAAIENGGAS
jgi:multiple sugar transport system permease protein